MIILTVQRFFSWRKPTTGSPPVSPAAHVFSGELCGCVYSLHVIAPPELMSAAIISVSHLWAIPGCSRCLRLLPDVCPLVVCIRCNGGSFPLCVSTAAAAAATPHTLIIPPLRSLRPVGFFCPFLAGKCLHAELCQNPDQKKP